eukprot:6605556-Alexandrium_andersonii.AAC.1
MQVAQGCLFWGSCRPPDPSGLTGGANAPRIPPTGASCGDSCTPEGLVGGPRRRCPPPPRRGR